MFHLKHLEQIVMALLVAGPQKPLDCKTISDTRCILDSKIERQCHLSILNKKNPKTQIP